MSHLIQGSINTYHLRAEYILKAVLAKEFPSEKLQGIFAKILPPFHKRFGDIGLLILGIVVVSRILITSVSTDIILKKQTLAAN